MADEDFEGEDEDYLPAQIAGMEFPIMGVAVRPTHIVFSLLKAHFWLRLTDVEGNRIQGGWNFVSPVGEELKFYVEREVDTDEITIIDEPDAVSFNELITRFGGMVREAKNVLTLKETEETEEDSEF